MSAETEHNEHLDLFSLKVRQKLEDHRLPVDMKGWEQIEAKMTERPRLSVWRIGGWATVAAAVLALLLLIRLYPTTPVPTSGTGSQEEGRSPKRRILRKWILKSSNRIEALLLLSRVKHGNG